MKKIVSILVVIAMLMAVAPAVFANDGVVNKANLDTPNVAADSEEQVWASGSVDFTSSTDYKVMNFTAPGNGALTVTISNAVPGYDVGVNFDWKTGTDSGSHAWDVVVGETYEIVLYAWDPETNWDSAGTYDYVITYVGEGTVEPYVEPVAGETADNPVNIPASGTITVPAGKTYYFLYAPMMPSGGDLSLTVNGVSGFAVTPTPAWGMPMSTVDTNGTAAATVSYARMYGGYHFAVTNNTDSDQTYTYTLAEKKGTSANPDELVIGNNTAETDGTWNGYYYLWIADEAGYLTITMTDATWTYMLLLNDEQVGDYYYSDDETVVSSKTIEVVAGDRVIVWVNTYDATSMYDPNPAGTVNFTAAFSAEAPDPGEGGGEAGTDPVDLYASQENPVTVPAGATVSGNVLLNGSMDMVVVGEGDFTVIYNGVEYPAVNGTVTVPGVTSNYYNPTVVQFVNNSDSEATYVVTFAAPVGSMDNPAELVIGAYNTAVIPEGSMMGYVFTWTATADGTLTIRMPEDMDWSYSINNLTSYIYGDRHFSDEDPVVNPATIEVAEGDVIQISVSSYDPANWSNTPAATLEIWADFEPAGGEGGGEGGEPVGDSGIATSEADTKFTVPFSTDVPGTLTVTVGDGTTDWTSDVYSFASWSAIGSLSGSAEGTYSVRVEPGVSYYIRIYATDGGALAATPYSYTFTPDSEGGEGGEIKEETALSDTVLVVGENNVTLNPNAITTLFTFAPDETGVYKIEVADDGAVMTLWLPSTWSKLEDAVDGVLTVEISSVGQNWLIGLSGADAANVTITKTGESGEVVIPEVEYENKAELNQFEVPGNATTGAYVDVYGDTHTAVLGEDGYYHLDSADGPILLVDMDYLTVLTNALSDPTGRGVMYAYVTLEDGSQVKYNIGNAALEYMEVIDENGYYPLTEDLIFFYQVYAVGNGVPQFVLEEGYNEECAWMFACLTMTLSENEGGVPGTGDNSAIDVAIAVALVSAMSIVALPVVKKHF